MFRSKSARLAPLALAALLATTRSARSAPREEVRGIWVTRWDFRTASDVRSIVARCAALGLNRIYLQVRGRADAFYRSSYEPWAEELGGRDPGFDPLGLAVAEAHARGIELHAWVNTLAGWKGTKPPRSPRHIWHRHPDWFLLARGGSRQRLDEHYVLVNPCWPEVRLHIARTIGEIAAHYPVDGIHLDYIRFIATTPAARQAVPYDNRTLAQFRGRTGGFPTRFPREWDEFRREAVNTLMRQVTAAVRSARPGITVTAAVLGDFERARDVYFQDASRWLREGLVDAVVPMLYQKNLRPFVRRARESMRRAGPGRHVAGIGAYMLESPTALRRQIESCRSLGGAGYALFAYTSFYPTPSPASPKGRDVERLRSWMRSALRDLNRAPARLPIGPTASARERSAPGRR